MASTRTLKALEGRLYLIVIALIFFSFTPAFGQVTFTTDKAQFLADNPNLLFQDFESTKVPDGGGDTCNVPVDSESDDDCFSPGDILPQLTFYNLPTQPMGGLKVLGTNAAGPGTPPGPILIENTGTDTFDVVVDPGVTRIGLTVGCYTQGKCDTTADIVVLDTQEQLIGQTTVNVDSAFSNFLGISSSVPICCVLIQHRAGQDPDHGNGILNVWFGDSRNIPALSEWGMIAAIVGLGFVGVFFAARRRRAQASNTSNL